MKLQFLFICTIVLGLSFNSVGQPRNSPKLAKIKIQEMDQVILKFQDSSVPPKYHRSYKIIANEKNTKVQVSSYGDILATDNFPTDKAIFTEIKDLLSAGVDVNTAKNRQMPGSTVTTLKFKYEGKVVFKKKWVSNKHNASLKRLQNKVKALVPELQTMLNTPLPKKGDKK